MFSFADDKAPTRDKMLLAATKATFKNEFGLSFIRHDIQISNPSDLSLEKFERQISGFTNGMINLAYDTKTSFIF
jgi:hypothetical protein